MEREVDVYGNDPKFDFSLVLRTNKILVAGLSFDVPQEKYPPTIVGIKRECRGQGCFTFSMATNKTSLETKEIGIVFRNIEALSVYHSNESQLSVLILHLSENIADKLLAYMEVTDLVREQIRNLALPLSAKKSFVFPIVDNINGVGCLTKSNGTEVNETISTSQLDGFLKSKITQKRQVEVNHKHKKTSTFFDTLDRPNFYRFLDSHGLTLDVSMKNILPKAAALPNPNESVKSFLSRFENKKLFLQKDFLQHFANGVKSEPHNEKITLNKLSQEQPKEVVLNLHVPNLASNATPDLNLARKGSRKRCQEMTLDSENEHLTPQKMGPEDMAIASSSNSSLLTYPSKGLDRITITFHDMRTLQYNEMLNDTIVDFWMSYIKFSILPEENRNDVHIFSSFFYKKLTEKIERRHIAKTARSAELRFEAVSSSFKQICKWTRKVNLFTKKYIVIPVIEDLHWYLAIVTNPMGMINGSSEGPFENNSETRKRGTIRSQPESFVITFDSLVDEDPKRIVLVDILRDYFELEFQDKKQFPEMKFERTRLGGITPSNLPQQSNFIDCGLYILKFAESFLSKPPDIENMKNFDWVKEYPFFSLDMNFCRETVRATIRKLVSKEDWEKFLLWESDNKFAPNPSTGESSAIVRAKHDEGILDRARRPRRYTEFGINQLGSMGRKQSHYGNSIQRRRYKSLPAKLDFIDRTFVKTS